MAARSGNVLFWLGMLIIANGTMMPACLAGDSRAVPDICKAHMSIHYMAAIKSTSDALDDRWSCAFEPEPLEKRYCEYATNMAILPNMVAGSWELLWSISGVPAY